MKILLALLGAVMAITAADLTVGWNHHETATYIIDGRTATNTLSPNGAAERFLIEMQHAEFPAVVVPLTNIIDLFKESVATNRYGHVRSNMFHHTFTNLPAGNWRFRVQALSWAGVPSEFQSPLLVDTNRPSAPAIQQIIVRLP